MDKNSDDQESEPLAPAHHENIIERVADELESRFLAAAEVATGTTSAETNLANAALTAIEGPRDPEPPDASDAEGNATKGPRQPA